MQHQNRLISSLVTFFCILLLSGSAAHATKPRVGVFPFQSAESSLTTKDLKSLSTQFLNQLAVSGKYRLSRRYPLTGNKRKVTPNQKQQKLKELRPLTRNLNKVAGFLRASQFEKAVALGEKSIKQAEGLIHWKESLRILGRLQALSTIAYLQLGRNDDAEQALKRLAILNLKQLPLEVRKNRFLRFRYKRAKRSIRSLSKGSVQVIGTPGAEVFVNGRRKGTIPVAISNLTYGRHYIFVRKNGFLTWGQVLVLKRSNQRVKAHLTAKAQNTVNNVLERAKQELVTAVQSGSLNDPNLASSIRIVCQSSRADWLMTAGLKKASPRYYLLTPFRIRCSDLSVKTYESQQLATELLDTDTHVQRLARLMVIRPVSVAVNNTNPNKTGTGNKTDNKVNIGKDPGKTEPKKSNNAGVVTGIIVGVVVLGASAGTAAYFLLRDPRVKVTAKWNP